VKVEFNQFFETQWSQFLKKTSNRLKGVFYQHDESKPLIYINDSEYIGDADQFSQWALYNFAYQDKDGLNAYTKMTKEAQLDTFNNAKNRDYAQMHITHSGENEVVVFELFSDIAPKTCANFMALC